MIALCECGCGEPAPIAPFTDNKRGYVKGKPFRFVHGHNMRPRSPGWIDEDRGYKTPCWIWQGCLDNHGYGQTSRKGYYLIHRWTYEHYVGPIPDSLQLDHLCRVPACCNPDHLEPVTSRENTLRGTAPSAANARKTHCHNGHEFTPENTYIETYGARRCLACKRNGRLQRQQMREAA